MEEHNIFVKALENFLSDALVYRLVAGVPSLDYRGVQEGRVVMPDITFLSVVRGRQGPVSEGHVVATRKKRMIDLSIAIEVSSVGWREVIKRSTRVQVWLLVSGIGSIGRMRGENC